jgi:hypothetical protein
MEICFFSHWKTFFVSNNYGKIPNFLMYITGHTTEGMFLTLHWQEQ